MTEHDHDQAPESLPAVLSAEQAARVRKALASYLCRATAKEASDALGYAPKYVQAFLRAEIHCTLHFAASVASAISVDVDALVRGDGP
ncbi:hypothetical protein [Polyangium sp. 6x1]|uniref:hypothetical protein n=1 Tax=Polyangium sp. 6x1 TaxID=3042689 RepID=UPI0024822263|nr:hypothetical protein [Polyangium sp. 6x1]MDI1447276.1 hypothetical protein [Polyangium sp. 6x1]